MVLLKRLQKAGRGIAGATLVVLALSSRPAHAEDLTIFAAASLKNVLDEISETFTAQTGLNVTVSLAGSSAIARQIEEGAPADVFISANPDWMDVLEKDGLIDPQSRFDLAGNRLALVAAAGTAPTADIVLEIDADFDLKGRLGSERLAMAFVKAVPAGMYGKAALETLGLWEIVEAQVAQADNVRSALALVALGAAPLGVVYSSDAQAEPRVEIAGLFPQDSHPPILYPAAKVTGAVPHADAYLAFLAGPDAARILSEQGFLPLAE